MKIKYSFFIVFISFTFSFIFGQNIQNSNFSYDVIPKVQELEKKEGYFELTKNTLIANFSLKYNPFTSLNLKKSSDSKLNSIQILFQSENDENFEEYELEIKPDVILVKVNSKLGITRAFSTLAQLSLLNNNHIPCAKIRDYPVFKHRGMQLDCGRHIFSVETIKKQLDLMALYKLNTLHWHLTEDQGWRIEIDQYSKLMEVGAYRIEKDGTKYGGFYTKEQIREIVHYATERGITVIPEIELPGHSQAAIASYPNLSCTGKPIPVGNRWGVYEDIYCAGNEDVFTFLENVLTEVMELFPSKYIHIGGDEAPKERWQHCPKGQKRIKEEHLKNEKQLQSYFIKRIQKFLNSKEREIIGWDEILEGGLPTGAIVQSWRGMEGGIKAVENGNNVIMSPESDTYFNKDLETIDLEKVYNFNPVPANLNRDLQALILGSEGNLWSEYITNEAELENQAYPRILALSEVLWTDSSSKNYLDFNKRIQNQYRILDYYKVKYGAETVPVTYELFPFQNGTLVKLKPTQDQVQIKYQLKTKSEESEYIEYKEPVKILESSKLFAQGYKHNEKLYHSIELNFEPHLAAHSAVEYLTPYREKYKANGELTLTDTQIGTLDFKDGAWQGFTKDTIQVVLDLTKNKKPINSITVRFFKDLTSWILLPSKIKFYESKDNKNWQILGQLKPKGQPNSKEKTIETFALNINKNEQYPFIKLEIDNNEKLPDWHAAAGSKGWIFIDEIIVK